MHHDKGCGSARGHYLCAGVKLSFPLEAAFYGFRTPPDPPFTGRAAPCSILIGCPSQFSQNFPSNCVMCFTQSCWAV